MSHVSIQTAARFVAMNVADFDTAGHSSHLKPKKPRWGLSIALLLIAAAVLAFGFA